VMDELARATRPVPATWWLHNAAAAPAWRHAEPDDENGWSVKLGALFPLSELYASARLLAASSGRANMDRMVPDHAGARRTAPPPRRHCWKRCVASAETGNEIAPSGRRSPSPISASRADARATRCVPDRAFPGANELTSDRRDGLALHARAARTLSPAIAALGPAPVNLSCPSAISPWLVRVSGAASVSTGVCWPVSDSDWGPSDDRF